jgi:hypothetical protein
MGWYNANQQKVVRTVIGPVLDVPWKIIHKHNPFFDEQESIGSVLPVISNQ